MKKRTTFILLITIPLLFLGYRYANEKYFLIAKNLDIFATLFKEVNAHYVDEIDPTELVEVGINAMLESLDPYTNFIPEEDIEAFRTVTTGQYAGIGVLVANINGKTKVTRVYDGHSADREGIKVGDEMISVAGTSVESSSIPEIGKLLRGQPSSAVEVVIKRPPAYGEITFQLERENIIIGNVPYYGMINSQVGYIKLEDFAVGAGREVKEALIELRDKGAESIILDLRGNGGGLLSEAINISNLFIEKGSEVVSTKGRIEDWNKTYKALNSPTDTKMPLALLIDGGSASASEIVAGVIQDYDRGILVGRNTFGKGLVQTTRPLTYNSQLKVTTAKYYIPSGRCIQAIDYGKEKPQLIEVSERGKYQTANGREVFDGSGLVPDIKVDEDSYSAISRNLAYPGYLFEYGVKYAYSQDTFDSARELQISDADYNDFIKWVQSIDFTYKNEVENNLESLIETAKTEQYYADLENDINTLIRNIRKNKERDLLNFKEEISNLLNREIAGILYDYEGEIENSFSTDKDIAEAAQILSDKDRYDGILNR